MHRPEGLNGSIMFFKETFGTFPLFFEKIQFEAFFFWGGGCPKKRSPVKTGKTAEWGIVHSRRFEFDHGYVQLFNFSVAMLFVDLAFIVSKLIKLIESLWDTAQ